MFVTISSKPWLLKLDFATIAIKYYHILFFFQFESRFEILYEIIKIPPSENTSSVQFWSGKSVAISRRKTIIAGTSWLWLLDIGMEQWISPRKSHATPQTDPTTTQAAPQTTAAHTPQQGNPAHLYHRKTEKTHESRDIPPPSDISTLPTRN